MKWLESNQRPAKIPPRRSTPELHFNIYIGAQHRYRASLDTVLLPISNIRFVAKAIPRLVEVVGYFLSLWSWQRDSNPRPTDYKSVALPTELYQHIIPTLFILLWDGSRKVIVMIVAKIPRLELGHGITRYYRFSRPTPYQLGLKLHLVADDGFEPPTFSL